MCKSSRVSNLSKINAQIAASREHLRELRRQREAILDARRVDKRPRNNEILRLFDDEGLTSRQISRKMGLSDTLVRQFLYSRGRTRRGREAVRSQLIIMQETQK